MTLLILLIFPSFSSRCGASFLLWSWTLCLLMRCVRSYSFYMMEFATHSLVSIVMLSENSKQFGLIFFSVQNFFTSNSFPLICYNIFQEAVDYFLIVYKTNCIFEISLLRVYFLSYLLFHAPYWKGISTQLPACGFCENPGFISIKKWQQHSNVLYILILCLSEFTVYFRF